MITLDHISVRLPAGKTPSTEILHNIHLDINRGEWIAIAGANGCGKTTLLHAIAGVAPPSEGQVRYSSGRPRTALMLQEPDNQFVASSVRNELKLSVPADTDRADATAACAEAVERFDLANFLDRNPHRLSGGEQQRLALATVWLATPELLLLDEPTAFLDDEQRTKCLAFVRSLNERSVTVLWATPDGRDIDDATRVIALDDGCVAYDGPAHGYTTGTVAAVTSAPHPSEPVGAPIVTLRDVTFDYGEAPVLSEVSFDFYGGECVGVLGRNGSGKTTLLDVLSGALDPLSGAVKRDYEKIVEEERQQVFHLVQNPERLFFAETVREELAFGLTKLGVGSEVREARASAALMRVGLPPDEFLSRSPFSLSFGEMRRLAFALATTLEPRVLLMDEPTSCLDNVGKSLFVELVRSLVSSGAAVVVASHDETLVQAVCSRTLTLP